ncbi:MAG TPA: pilus assembly protein PilM [Actinomycetota bacterium]|nr:pilus assembly protein PilM [Actinomycetota bacterium]
MARVRVGLEVGSSAVRLAAVTRSRSGPSLKHVGAVPLPPGVVVDGDVVDTASLTEATRYLIKTVKPGSKDVHLGVVGQRMVARQVDLPWVPPKEFKQALPLLAADCLPMPVEGSVLDFLAFEEVLEDDGARMLRGLLVAAGEDSLLEMVDAVEAAGVRVVSVTLTPLSTLGAVADPLAPEPEALLDIGYAMTSVTVHEHGQPRFVRILSRGGRDITTSLADSLGISEPDAERWKCGLPGMWASMDQTDRNTTETAVRTAVADLVAEIRTSVDFYRTSAGSRIGRAHVVGGAGSTLGLIPILAEVLRVPVVAGSPKMLRYAGSLTADETAFAAGPGATAAVGLALGAA